MLTEDLLLDTGLLDTFLPLIKAHYLDSVSYTHLDVYKRQRRRKRRTRRSGGPSWACLPSGITRTLWIPARLRSPQRALSATAAAR